MLGIALLWHKCLNVVNDWYNNSMNNRLELARKSLLKIPQHVPMPIVEGIKSVLNVVSSDQTPCYSIDDQTNASWHPAVFLIDLSCRRQLGFGLSALGDAYWIVIREMYMRSNKNVYERGLILGISWDCGYNECVKSQSVCLTHISEKYPHTNEVVNLLQEVIPYFS